MTEALPATLPQGETADPAHVTTPEQLHQLIDEHGRFNGDEESQFIAHSLVQRLDINAQAGVLTEEQLTGALDALYALIPTDNGRGGRQIDGRTLKPETERRIASRLSSPEIDMAAPDGAWGCLPEGVKKVLTWETLADLKMELTTNCTVGCGFCSFADKGPIGGKASFESVREVLQFYRNHRADPRDDYMYDNFFWGTDPFDIRWAATDGVPERDYRDLARLYRTMFPERGLFTSTALPLGEEMRILACFDEFWPVSESKMGLRISETNANLSRATLIKTVLQALNPDRLLGARLYTNKAYEHVAARSETAWGTMDEVTTWDVLGPNCRDGVIISPKGLFGVVMQAASPERPTGELKFPIETVEDGNRHFRLPRHVVGAAHDRKAQPHNAYSDAVIHHIVIRPDGSTSSNIQVMSNDPHRAALRVAWGVDWYDRSSDNPAAVGTFRIIFSDSLRLIEEYLETNQNPALSHLLSLATARNLWRGPTEQ